MPKIAKELTPLAVSKIRRTGLHAVGGINGLGLKVMPSGSRAWVLRTMVAGKRREFGLGGYPSVTLASARDRARTMLDQLFAGIDPAVTKKQAKSQLAAQKARAITFKSVAEQYIAQHEAGWKNAKHAAQWTSTLSTYAYPVCGRSLVADIDTAAVLRVLQPIWVEKSETASRLRGRIESILDYATARGLREGTNPARWKGHLALTLPSKRKVSPVKHHPAVPVTDMPAFFKELQSREGIAARALEFLTLTAARSGEVRGAQWGEIDLAKKVWTVPAERMKAKREHRVPLSTQVIALLKALPSSKAGGLLFPGSKPATKLSDMALTSLMRRMQADAVPHGMRASFRNWTAEETAYPNEVAEMALAHSVRNLTEAAYRRGDLFEKRRLMMQDWAAFLTQSPFAGASHGRG
ncbi:MAG: tyrosine-type recombinase/integrase [Oxalobacteraceae bacterium]